MMISGGLSNWAFAVGATAPLPSRKATGMHIVTFLTRRDVGQPELASALIHRWLAIHKRINPPPCLGTSGVFLGFDVVFWEEPLKVRSKPPPPQIRCRLRMACVSRIPSFQRFFASFFGLVFCRFLAVPGLILGAILPPFSAPKSDLFFDWFFN